MALKSFVKDLESVEEPFRSLYNKTDDGFLLSLDDKDYKARIEEFRSNNLSLIKKKEELEKSLDKYKHVDLEKYEEAKEALERLEQDEEGQLIKQGKIDDVLKKRTESMRKDYEAQSTALKKQLSTTSEERDNYKKRLQELVVDVEIQKAVSSIGSVRQGALSDVLNRAHKSWSLDEKGHMVPKNGDGEIIYGKKGDPLTIEEWASGLLNEAPFLFESAKGGGSEGGKKSQSTHKPKVDTSDPLEFGRHLEAIAKGQVQVS